MITSEAQRTLVKSPPELWAELSDPESLARHLGELGEIRITRTDPEQLVEWEAEGTTGSVRLKATGWGTKVTLTVSRELAEEPPQASETSSDQGDAVAEEAESQPTIEPDSIAAIEAEAEADEPDAGAGDPQPKPAPATEAARRAAGWPTPAAAEGPAIESDLRAAEESVEALSEDREVRLWSVDPAPWRAEAQPEPASETAEREPRPGFFARLFGARRRKAAAQPAALHEELNAAVPKAASAQQPQPDGVDGLGEPIAHDTSAEPAIVSLQEPEADDSESAPAAWGEPVAEENLEPGAEDDLEQVAEEPEAPQAEAQAETEDRQDGAVDPPSADGQDLAGELKAAEEIATEEVAAVLTAVLDRLGAAHHRPFSRA